MAMKGADTRPRQALPLSRIGRRSVALGGRGVNAWVDFPSGDRWPSPVEGAALEMPYSRKAVLGSNPSLSATPKPDCAAWPAPKLSGVDLNNLVPWLFIAAVLVFVIPASVYMYTLQQRRSKAYVAFAAANGYQYVFKRPGQETAYVNVLPMFNQGHSRTWQHELSGAFNGLTFTAFEYVYIIGYGKNQTVHRQAMIKWESAGASLPQFTLGPAGFFARIWQALGLPDIDFSDDEAFSRSYVLK